MRNADSLARWFVRKERCARQKWTTFPTESIACLTIGRTASKRSRSTRGSPRARSRHHPILRFRCPTRLHRAGFAKSTCQTSSLRAASYSSKTTGLAGVLTRASTVTGKIVSSRSNSSTVSITRRGFLNHKRPSSSLPQVLCPMRFPSSLTR